MSEFKPGSMDEHQLTVSEVCNRYSTQVDDLKPSTSIGLNQDQISRNQLQYGSNTLTPPVKKSPIIQFLECLFAMFNILLMVASALTFVLYALDPVLNVADLYLGIILIVVAVLNALIEFIQIRKSAAMLDSFLKLIPQLCYVVRGGRVGQVNASELVPGDLVYVKMGDKVPADLRLVSCTELKVDNSSLTGESDPQLRKLDMDRSNPLEATNLAFNGTLAVSGEGYGIVIRIGDSTVLGQIANLTSTETKRDSLLTMEISRFITIISTLAMVTAFTFLIFSMVKYQDLHISLNFAIGAFVAWIPEGLPITVTMLLTVAASRMADQKVLVKDLKGVETLGAITLLATDKTGTLTKNQMTVSTAWASLDYHSNLAMLSHPDCDMAKDFPGVEEILFNASLNSQVTYDTTLAPFEQRKVIGDATEQGLARFGYRCLNDYDEVRERHAKVFSLPFNSETKWAMSIHHLNHAYGDLCLFVKGAPERVLKLCSTILVNGKAVNIDQSHIGQFQHAYQTMAKQGHRVIAFGQMLLPREQYPAHHQFDDSIKNAVVNQLCFVGLVSLEDPPKHGVREAIGKCRSAGIKVMMVTGDHPLTAEAIARKINLMTSDTRQSLAERTMRPLESIQPDEYDAIVVTGDDIDTLDDESWDFILLKKEVIFARTSPQHKLEIVKRAQSMGHIVGVTGDGVNDSPALKKADLGIAMNHSGSDVSKDAASMILLDDNFASTVRGIEEGRLIFTNLKKSVQYTISHTMPELIPQLLFIIVPIPLPISSILIIVIDLGFELFAALSYAWDPPETPTGLMKLFPRKPVDATSIERFRRHQAFDAPMPYATRTQKFTKSLFKLFSPTYWKNQVEPSSDELLMDFNVISWAYLEVGILETLFCHIAFFALFHINGITIHDSHLMQSKGLFKSGSDAHTASSGVTLDDLQQLEVLAQGQSLYYLSVMILQAFNLFATKSQLRLPFGKHIFRNYRNFLGLAIGLALGMLIVYTPSVSTVFGTSPNLEPAYWLIPIAGGIAILLYSCFRFILKRKLGKSRFNQDIVGLQMHPTVFTHYDRLS